MIAQHVPGIVLGKELQRGTTQAGWFLISQDGYCLAGEEDNQGNTRNMVNLTREVQKHCLSLCNDTVGTLNQIQKMGVGKRRIRGRKSFKNLWELSVNI